MRVCLTRLSIAPDLLIKTGIGHAGLVAGQAVEPLERVRRQGDAAFLAGHGRDWLALGRLGHFLRSFSGQAPMQADTVIAARHHENSPAVLIECLPDHRHHERLAAAIRRAAGAFEQAHVAAQVMSAFQICFYAQVRIQLEKRIP